MLKKYHLKVVKKFASVTINETPIPTLSGLYLTGEQDENQLKEIVRLANVGLDCEGKETK